MCHELKAAFLWRDAQGIEVLPQDVAVLVESKMLAHAVERGLGERGGTVPRTPNVVEGFA